MIFVFDFAGVEAMLEIIALLREVEEKEKALLEEKQESKDERKKRG